MIDQLEERTLLSIWAGGAAAQLINQNTLNLPAQLTTATNPSIITQAMVTGKSVATDNNGDFVVVWSQNDGVYDANGNVIVDPNTGLAMSDDNVYARYFTEASADRHPDGHFQLPDSLWRRRDPEAHH